MLHEGLGLPAFMEAIHHRHGEFFHWNSSLEHFIQTVHICYPHPPRSRFGELHAFILQHRCVLGRTCRQDIYQEQELPRLHVIFLKVFFWFSRFSEVFLVLRKKSGVSFCFYRFVWVTWGFFENFLQLFMLCIQMSAAESVQMNDEILHWIRIGWYVDCQR